LRKDDKGKGARWYKSGGSSTPGRHPARRIGRMRENSAETCVYTVLDAKVRVLVVGHAQIAGGKKTRASKSNAPAPSFPFAAVIGSRPAGTVLSRRPPLESKEGE